MKACFILIADRCPVSCVKHEHYSRSHQQDHTQKQIQHASRQASQVPQASTSFSPPKNTPGSSNIGRCSIENRWICSSTGAYDSLLGAFDLRTSPTVFQRWTLSVQVHDRNMTAIRPDSISRIPRMLKACHALRPWCTITCAPLQGGAGSPPPSPSAAGRAPSSH